MSLSNQ